MDDLELKELGGFIGTQSYYAVLGANVTDGVKYIMDNGYSWFVTDTLAVVKGLARLKAQPFLAVKLKRTANKEADVTIEDGNDNILHSQHYGYTDAKKDVTLYFVDNVLMLSNEY